MLWGSFYQTLREDSRLKRTPLPGWLYLARSQGFSKARSRGLCPQCVWGGGGQGFYGWGCFAFGFLRFVVLQRNSSEEPVFQMSQGAQLIKHYSYDAVNYLQIPFLEWGAKAATPRHLHQFPILILWPWANHLVSLISDSLSVKWRFWKDLMIYPRDSEGGLQ